MEEKIKALEVEVQRLERSVFILNVGYWILIANVILLIQRVY